MPTLASERVVIFDRCLRPVLTVLHGQRCPVLSVFVVVIALMSTVYASAVDIRAEM